MLLPCYKYVVWNSIAFLIVMAALELAGGQAAAQESLTLSQQTEQMQIAVEARQGNVLMVWGAGLLALLLLFIACWCLFHRAPENSLRRRLVGSLFDPEAQAAARFEQLLKAARQSAQAREKRQPVRQTESLPKVAPGPGVNDWATNNGTWLTRCEVALETWPRRAEGEPAEAHRTRTALLQQVLNELAPQPDQPPGELLARAQFCVRCQALFTKSGWPIVYELVCRYWAGDREGIASVAENIKPDHIREVDRRLLPPLAEALLQVGRHRAAAHVYAAIRTMPELKAEGDAMTAWCKSLIAGEQPSALPTNWREEVKAMEQRLAAG